MIGPDYGYHPNALKTWLIVNDEKLENATTAFEGTGVNITSQGKRYLGAALGTRTFVKEYVQRKVADWVDEVECLSLIANTHPHAAYAAFTNGLSSRWTYIARTIPDVGDLLKPLEFAIRHRFLTALTGRTAVSDAEWDLMALPVRLGGLGISNPTKQATLHYNTSQKVTTPLVALILQQSCAHPAEYLHEQGKAKLDARKIRNQQQNQDAEELLERLPANMRRALEVSKEKRGLSWLSTLPIAEDSFALHKGAFRDTLCLCYGWRPADLPSVCICGKNFSVEHALSCPHGGLPSVRHNELRDITAQMLT